MNGGKGRHVRLLVLLGLILTFMTACFGGLAPRRITNPTVVTGVLSGPPGLAGDHAAFSSPETRGFLAFLTQIHPARFSQLARAASVSVSGESELANVVVAVYDLKAFLADPHNAPSLLDGTTDAEGKFTLTNIPKGKDLIIVAMTVPQLSAIIPATGADTSADINSATTLVAHAWAPALKDNDVSFSREEWEQAVQETRDDLNQLGLDETGLMDALNDLVPQTFGDGLPDDPPAHLKDFVDAVNASAPEAGGGNGGNGGTGYRVSGVILDTAGAGVEGIEVSAGPGSSSAVTDVDGFWELTGMSGVRILTATGTDYQMCPLGIPVQGEESDIEFSAHARGGGAAGMGGAGEQGDPYVISDVNELQAIDQNLNAHYMLCDDIDASDTATWANGGFSPIGKVVEGNEPFTGSLDGGGYSISGLTINLPEEDQVGLFATIGDTGMVRNLRIVDGSIKGYDRVGALAGNNTGAHDDIINSASVSGHNYVGGLIGYHESGDLENLRNSGSVRGDAYVGGIVGYTRDANITDVVNEGTIDGDRYVGGIVGRTLGWNTQAKKVSFAENYGDVTAMGATRHTNAGGIAGLMTSTDASDLSNAGTVTGKGTVGGIVAEFERDGSGTSWIQYADNSGFVSGYSNVGGIVGYLGSDTRLSFSHNVGAVEGGLSTGGVVGIGFSELISVTNTGPIEGLPAEGEREYFGSVGGVAGSFDGKVEKVFNTGTVEARGGPVGGILGSFQGNLTGAYNLGDVTTPLINSNPARDERFGYDHMGVGGAIGAVSKYTFGGTRSTIKEIYSAGEIVITNTPVTDYVGGLIGNNVLDGGRGGDVERSYWDTDTAGLSVSSGGDSDYFGTGLTTDEMFDPESYENWGRSNISWIFYDGVDYPDLNSLPR